LKTGPIVTAAVFLSCLLLWGAVGGSISGTVKSSSGIPVAGVQITVTNTAQGIQTKSTSNAKGAYRLPNLPVGRYDLKTERTGFKSENRRGLVVHVDDVIRIDLILEASEKADPVTTP
jgi:hypothetical protein